MKTIIFFKKVLSLKFMLYLSMVLSNTVEGYSQATKLSMDSIPLVNDEVFFVINFEADLNKSEFQEKTHFFLDSILEPYSGVFLKNTIDSTLCLIVDYIDVSSTPMQVFGMYMTYNLKMVYKDELSIMTIKDISFMEKGYFEKQEESLRKLDMPVYSAKDIMIDKKYKRLMTKSPSEKITDAALNRINEIIKNLEFSFR